MTIFVNFQLIFEEYLDVAFCKSGVAIHAVTNISYFIATCARNVPKEKRITSNSF